MNVFIADRPLEINIMKTIEELSELQLELIKYITKGKEGKFDLELVKGEMADVLLSIDILMKQLDIESEVKELIPIKLERGIFYAKKYGFRKGLNFDHMLV